MIGKYLLTLIPAAEDALLTTPFEGGKFRTKADPDGTPCLVEVVHNMLTGGASRAAHYHVLNDFMKHDEGEDKPCGIPLRYDTICLRFGEARVNGAIRNRILSNRARRALAPARTPEPANAGGQRELTHSYTR